MRLTIVIISVLILFTNPIIGFSQSKVEQSKGEVKKGSETNNQGGIKKSSTASSSSSSSYDDDDETLAEIVARGIFKGFLYVSYYAAIGDYMNEDHLYNNITKYPFYNDTSGNYEITDYYASTDYFLRVDVENQFLIGNDNVFGNHLKTKIRPFQYFYMQLDYFQLMEFNKVNGKYPNLSLFNLSVCYDRLRFEKFNLGWSLGMNYMANDVQKVGFLAGFNTEAFIAKTVSLNGSMRWSQINTVPVNEFEINCKYFKKNYFVSLGYEYLKIGTPDYHFISLGGGIYF